MRVRPLPLVAFATLFITLGVAPAALAHRGSVVSPRSQETVSRISWGRYTVVVERVILDPDSPPDNYRQLRIVDARGRTVKTVREAYIGDVRVVRLLGNFTGELWFQASTGGHNGLGMCGAYTQAGGLRNILFARDVFSATAIDVGQGGPRIVVRQGLDGPFPGIHDFPEVTLVYAWDGRHFAGVTARRPAAALAEATKAREALLRDGGAPDDQVQATFAFKDTVQYLADMTAAGRKSEGVSWLDSHAPSFVRKWLATNRAVVTRNEKSIQHMQQPLPVEDGRVIDDMN